MFNRRDLSFFVSRRLSFHSSKTKPSCFSFNAPRSTCPVCGAVCFRKPNDLFLWEFLILKEPHSERWYHVQHECKK